MFEKLSNKISQTVRNVIYSGRLTENNIRSTLNSIKVSLLEADVALPVVENFINKVKDGVIGKNVNKHLTPGQEFIKIMHAALTQTIGEGLNDLNLNSQTPTIILLIGTQGSGKTTTTGKLAKFLKNKKNKKVLVISTDIYRPAGMQQLKNLVIPENITFFSDFNHHDKPINIVKKAMMFLKNRPYDTIVIDTAGCLDTDNVLLSELSDIHNTIKPIETLFVIDSMMGQVSVNHANKFSKILPLTGVILTKLDGSTRGGVALSVKYLTKKPIKFIGTGENIDALEIFNAYRIAGRILGMGDILSLIDELDNKEQFLKHEKYIQKNNADFNLCDFLNYIKQIRNMGGINKIISKLPKLGMGLDNIQQSHIQNNIFTHMEAIINSMTIKERIQPNIINGSRKKRIATGSGVKIQDINKLLNRFNQIRTVMKQINKNGAFQMVRTLKNKISSKLSSIK
ncbi:signal recognition particle protein [Candidatus Blochmannia ocreatus (nom. nud.)]|uniref:signal-recognition-particle GTPase n=1 Tax=Candidatus Blochmannia ocreatus (nom. nud.) TaxID=251538 RepID=A0ABY4SUU5_9ENTR|nr:signal recognition particle protein [Candidatus Blochmannia ocreatus]URJ25253.1 signal recognition particle protein [Candidatus Blochmannia ocreatus]